MCIFTDSDTELKDEDMIFLQHLSSITNVIPLIAKSDTLSLEEVEILRRSLDRLRHTEIKLFSFNSEDTPTRFAFTTCSLSSEDEENMDASVLMSPDYVQPLIPSELGVLLQQVFDPDNIACLRHLAAKKLVQAQGSKIFSMPSSPSSMTTRPSLRPTFSARSNTTQTIVPYVSPYKHAQISDHTQQEEKLAQIRLAKWAGELQRSLQNERARYEVRLRRAGYPYDTTDLFCKLIIANAISWLTPNQAIARGERAVWLTERLGECTNIGALITTRPASTNESEKGPTPTMNDSVRLSGHRGLLDAGDPLGLLRWNEAMKRRGWIAFQIMGTFGVVGAVAVWIVKSWGGSENYATWTWEWLGGRA